MNRTLFRLMNTLVTALLVMFLTATCAADNAHAETLDRPRPGYASLVYQWHGDVDAYTSFVSASVRIPRGTKTVSVRWSNRDVSNGVELRWYTRCGELVAVEHDAAGGFVTVPRFAHRLRVVVTPGVSPLFDPYSPAVSTTLTIKSVKVK